MDFAAALDALKSDRAVKRASWRHDLTICFMPSVTISAGLVTSRTRRFWPAGQDLHVVGYFVKILDGRWEPGWRPSSSDMSAEDWEVVESEEG